MKILTFVRPELAMSELEKGNLPLVLVTHARFPVESDPGEHDYLRASKLCLEFEGLKGQGNAPIFVVGSGGSKETLLGHDFPASVQFFDLGRDPMTLLVRIRRAALAPIG